MRGVNELTYTKDTKGQKGSKMTEYSTVSRIQDRILVALGQYPGGLSRRDLVQAVGEVDLDKGESIENQFRMALTALTIRGVVVSLPGCGVRLVKQF